MLCVSTLELLFIFTSLLNLWKGSSWSSRKFHGSKGVIVWVEYQLIHFLYFSLSYSLMIPLFGLVLQLHKFQFISDALFWTLLSLRFYILHFAS